MREERVAKQGECSGWNKEKSKECWESKLNGKNILLAKLIRAKEGFTISGSE